MPRKYTRKCPTRGQWSEENLRLAIEKVKKREISKREAERVYGIPIRTLTRRLKTDNMTKSGLGPSATLGVENERHLADYIRQLAAAGLELDSDSIRILAFQFAEKLNIKHKFSRETQKAGYDWLHSFLERNPSISIRHSKSFSGSKSESINRLNSSAFFKLLEAQSIENELVHEPEISVEVDTD